MIYYIIGDQEKKSLDYYGNSEIGDYLSKFFKVVSSISHDSNGLSTSLEKEFNNNWSKEFINELSNFSNYFNQRISFFQTYLKFPK
jgi:hypothetical protein